MLCLSGEAGYIHEPFNPARKPGWLAVPVPFWFLHISRENEKDFRPAVERLLRFDYPAGRNLRYVKGPRQLSFLARDAPRSLLYRIRKPRPLIKDPIALFSAEWLARTFGMQVVVMIRHPAAFAGSIKRLDWRFGFRGWAAQELLLRTYMEPFRDVISAYRGRESEIDIVDQAILMWNVMHHAIDQMRSRNPSWSFIRHEDLANAPEKGFHTLYDVIGLTWDERVDAAISRFSGERNPKEVGRRRRQAIRRNSAATTSTWRARLSPDEAKRVVEGTNDVARKFYSESELALG
jgi:hypothetical protein